MNARASNLHLIHARLDLNYMFSGFAISVFTSLEHDTRNMITFPVSVKFSIYETRGLEALTRMLF